MMFMRPVCAIMGTAACMKQRGKIESCSSTVCQVPQVHGTHFFNFNLLERRETETSLLLVHFKMLATAESKSEAVKIQLSLVVKVGTYPLQPPPTVSQHPCWQEA